MELFLQEKFSLNSKVVISDADKNPVFIGKKGFFSGKMKLIDATTKKKLATIIEKRSLFLGRRFIVKKGFKKLAKIKKKLSLVNQKFSIKNLGWDIKGNFTAKEYTITKGEELIATITRNHLIALFEGYRIEITNSDDAAIVVAIVMVLNKILGERKAKLI